jgi:perosamine synthetase
MNQQISSFIREFRRHISNDSFVPLHEPTMNGNELKYVTECVESGWVSSVGSYVNLFEERLASYTGAKYAIAVNNGTAALHVSLRLAGVTKNDEVLLPSLTFVATANAICYLDAIPHFIDVSESELTVDIQKLSIYLEKTAVKRSNGTFNKFSGNQIKAIVPMHTFGHPVQMDELMSLADHYNLNIIEDAAESLGSTYKNRQTGSMGMLSAVSFNGNKTITTGGGGAILTNDSELAKRARHLTTTAKLPHRWSYDHDEVGYNYRMPNINAALGVAQLESLDELILKKRMLHSVYQSFVSTIPGIELITEMEYSRSNYWLQTIRLNDVNTIEDWLLELNEAGIMSRPVWTPLHELPMYRHCPKDDLTHTEKLKKVLINVPSSSSLFKETNP